MLLLIYLIYSLLTGSIARYLFILIVWWFTIVLKRLLSAA